MSRQSRSERMANKGRPKRRAAAKTHFFKYQLTGDPSRAEENDLKRALQESLMEQFSKNTSSSSGSSSNSSAKKNINNHNNNIIISSTNSSDVSGSNRSNSTSRNSNETINSDTSTTKKRTRSSGTLINNVNNSTTTNKRAKSNYSNISNNNNNTDGMQNKSAPSILDIANSPPLIATQLTNKAIKTYSRSQINGNNNSLKQPQQKSQTLPGPKSSTPIKNPITRSNDKSPTIPKTTTIATTITTPTSNRSSNAQSECASKSTQTPSVSGILKTTPNISTKSDDSKKVHQSKLIDNHINEDNTSTNSQACEQPEQNQYLKSKRESKNYAYVKMTALKVSSSKSPSNSTKRVPQGSWSLLGVPEEKVIYLRQDEPPRRLICYPAIKHVEGDVIQVRDSVLLRSGARKTDLPFIAKVCAFWEDAETGNVMMSLFWYYRPEHTEGGRKPQHLADEIFASRHRDVDSVECIEDKCYVLTFNEYCRYRKRCKMEQVNTTWSLTDVTIPVSNELYPRKNRIPDSDVNPELVFCCRKVYDIYKHSIS